MNARHFKNVPGRKTDVSDSRWLCTLLQYGLLRGSFIPEAQIRQWLEINRLRRQITKNAADYKRRVHKVFETTNIKIDSKDKYYRLKARRGARRAIIAIARKLLTAIYYVIKEGKSYHELGEEYLTKKASNALSCLKKQAKLLGFQLVPIPQ